MFLKGGLNQYGIWTECIILNAQSDGELDFYRTPKILKQFFRKFLKNVVYHFSIFLSQPSKLRIQSKSTHLTLSRNIPSHRIKSIPEILGRRRNTSSKNLLISFTKINLSSIITHHVLLQLNREGWIVLISKKNDIIRPLPFPLNMNALKFIFTRTDYQPLRYF